MAFHRVQATRGSWTHHHLRAWLRNRGPPLPCPGRLWRKQPLPLGHGPGHAHRHMPCQEQAWLHSGGWCPGAQLWNALQQGLPPMAGLRGGCLRAGRSVACRQWTWGATQPATLARGWLLLGHRHLVPVPWLCVSRARLSRVSGHMARHYCSPLKKTRTTWGPPVPVATHSSPSGSASGKTSSVLTLARPRSVKAKQARAHTRHCWAPVWRTPGLTWNRFCRPYVKTASSVWPRWTSTHLRTWRTSFVTYHLSSRAPWCLERMPTHIWPGSARPLVWSAGPRCPWLVVISPAGCWSQRPCCDGICSTGSWSPSYTPLCSTISAGVFRPWRRAAPRSDWMPARTRHKPWPGNLRSCSWPVFTENAVRTRGVSCRHTSWKGQRPARPCVPSASGTWSLCCPLSYRMWPTRYLLAPRRTWKTCLWTDGSLRTWSMRQQQGRIPMNCLWRQNVWPWTSRPDGSLRIRLY